MFSTRLFFVFIFICVQFHLNQALPVDEQEKIIGGTDVTGNKFPWEVSIGSLEGVPKEKKDRQEQPLQAKLDSHKCGGVLLSKDYVVTFAFCVTSWIQSNSSIAVGIGSKSLSDIYDQGRVPVSEVIMMPDYKWYKALGDTDLSLLKLSPPSSSSGLFDPNNFKSFDPIVCLSNPVKCFTDPSSPVKPACLPKFALPEKQNYPSPLTAVGWGETKSSKGYDVPSHKSPTLKQVDMQDATATETSCRPKLICFPPSEGIKGPCQYDNGDSLVLNGDIVVGIANRFLSTQIVNDVTTCASVVYYSRMSSFTQWIQSHVGDDLCLK